MNLLKMNVKSAGPKIGQPQYTAAFRNYRCALFIFASSVCIHASSVNSANAQVDSIERFGTRALRGKIVDTSPTALTVQVSGSNQTVKPSEVRSITFGSTSGPIKKGIAAFYDERYNDCLETFEKVNSRPSNPAVFAEIVFCKAMSMAYEALGGGNVTVRQAGIEVKGFLDNHPDSFHVYAATRMFADLAMASGSISAAKPSYEKLLDAQWPELVMACHIELGEIGLIENDPDAAIQHFQAAVKVDTADKTSQSLQIVAKCRMAQANALKGDVDSAIKAIEAIIKQQSDEDSIVFSHAYNSLGNCYLKAGNSKAALLAFLHTQMLFAQPAKNQAEALYHLKTLWQNLNYPDRARKSQQTLTTSFSNTFFGQR